MARVFISYSSLDKRFVSKLARDLQALGHHIWLDDWMIKVGADIVEEIEQGLSQADYIVIVLTEHSVTSGWTKREWGSGYFNEVSERQAVVLPVLREKCNIPPLLRNKRYADFSENYNLGLAQLNAAITRKTDSFDDGAIKELTDGVRQLKDRIEERSLNPDILIAFERTSGIVAAILAQRMQIQEILVINRSINKSFSNEPNKSRIIVGKGLSLIPDVFQKKKVVVITFHLLTGENLRAGLNFLKQQGLTELPVFCLYISPVGRQRWPNVEWIYEHPDVQKTHSRLPWSEGEPHII